MAARVGSGMRAAVAAIVIVSGAFVAGRAVGGLRKTPEPAAAPGLMAIAQPAPDAVLHGDGTRAVSVRSLARQGSGPLVLVAMSTGCQSCDDDYPRWTALMKDYGTKARFVLLVCATDQDAAAPLRTQMDGFQSVYLCDTVLRRNWGIDRLPAVVVLDSAATVRFFDMGGPTARVTRNFLSQAVD